MIILTLDKKYWQDRGWTVEELDRRISSCREHQKEYRTFPEHSRYSYRLININLYRKYKTVRAILLGELKP